MLLAALMFLTLLVAITASAVYLVRIATREVGIQQDEGRAFWLAEAGMAKAIWNLMTPIGSGGQGEDWTTTGTTESLGDGSYQMVVTRWDFALSTNGSTASASSSKPGAAPSRVIDGNDATRWQSNNAPSSSDPEYLTITFPYPLSINKVRFFVASSFAENRPKDYTWQVSSDGTTFTIVVTVTGNTATDRTDTFAAAANVNYLRLSVTATGVANKTVQIGTLETIGAKLTSTGTALSTSRSIERTVVADDGSPEDQVAHLESDWAEL